MRLLAAASPEAREASPRPARSSVGSPSTVRSDSSSSSDSPAGFLSGALYALVGPLLPPGRAGGVALGALLLVFAGTRLEPLRADNPDFLIVGPAWLAVIAFTALGLFQGMLVTAMAARMVTALAACRP